MLILVPDSYNYVPRGRGLELFKLLCTSYLSGGRGGRGGKRLFGGILWISKRLIFFSFFFVA